ncbi:MAG: hypothetical protein M0P71_06505 [Melioribacteraceae bacterium]|nr:hypothetical protein [Melioribacteraceae bacterium]
MRIREGKEDEPRIEGYESWQKNETIRQAINLDNGVIQKPDILSFQNREENYPHAINN